MTYQTRFCLLVAAVSAVAVLAMLPDLALARAGGGGRGGAAAGIGAIFLAPFIAIYSAIVSYVAWKKTREARALLKRVAQLDPAWAPDLLKRRVEEVYFKVQYAWRDRDQDSARDCMSARLYAKHKLQTDDMKKRGVRNYMESINLNEVRIVEILDYKDDSKDRFWALIKGSMIDKMVEESTGKVIEGDDKAEAFQELWLFVREERGWVLDEIDQNVELGDFESFKSLSENLP